MRIPKRVNAALDWAEKHFGALAVVVTLVAASAAALLAPPAVGLPVAGFVLGLAFGGFAVYTRMVKRIARVRSDVDDLLRENGALRHRNTVLSSGVITRESQVTQALVAIPEEPPEEDPQGTVRLPELPDETGGPVNRTQPLDDEVIDQAAKTGQPPAPREGDGEGATRPAKSLDTGGNKTTGTGANKTVGHKPGGAKPGGNKPGSGKRAGGKSGTGKAAGSKARTSGNSAGKNT
ncbi:hypothetical protein SMC26_04485 [Actinomadura fulvescens]|uniref:Uncharacterized protein n=1 Tax=Actinomadura fulvescens TaxID=46160 RepID=A0ABP6C5N3_9ACTN